MWGKAVTDKLGRVALNGGSTCPPSSGQGQPLGFHISQMSNVFTHYGNFIVSMEDAVLTQLHSRCRDLLLQEPTAGQSQPMTPDT